MKESQKTQAIILLVLILAAIVFFIFLPKKQGQITEAKGRLIDKIYNYETDGEVKRYPSGSIVSNVGKVSVNIFKHEDNYWFLLNFDKIILSKLSKNLAFKSKKEIDISKYNYINAVQLNNGNIAFMRAKDVNAKEETNSKNNNNANIAQKEADNENKALISIDIWDMKSNNIVKTVYSQYALPATKGAAQIPLIVPVEYDDFIIIHNHDTRSDWPLCKELTKKDVLEFTKLHPGCVLACEGPQYCVKIQPIERYYYNRDNIETISRVLILDWQDCSKAKYMELADRKILLFGGKQAYIYNPKTNVFKKQKMPAINHNYYMEQDIFPIGKNLFLVLAKAIHICKYTDNGQIKVMGEIYIPNYNAQSSNQKTLIMTALKNSVYIRFNNAEGVHEYVYDIQKNDLDEIKTGINPKIYVSAVYNPLNINSNTFLIYDKFYNQSNILPDKDNKANKYKFGAFIKAE